MKRWTFGRNEDGDRVIWESDRNWPIMGDAKYYPWTPNDDEDWRLMAAAPELLEALQMMLKHFTKVPSTLHDSEARVRAHAAIRKATEG